MELGRIAMDYRQVSKLSHRVFLVEVPDTDIRLAAKIVDLENSSDSEIENLFKGIRFSNTVRQRNILPFLTTFVDQTDLWLLSPFCDGGTAGDACKPHGLEEPVIGVIVHDVVSALEYLHSRGIIHRSVKGSHILLRPKERRCLLTGLNSSISVLKSGKWSSTIHDYPHNAKDNLNWLAPEILEQNLLGYDSKSDIYSLGVTCCELANGTVPYNNMEPTEILLDKLTGNHPKPIDQTCVQLIKLHEGWYHWFKLC